MARSWREPRPTWPDGFCKLLRREICAQADDPVGEFGIGRERNVTLFVLPGGTARLIGSGAARFFAVEVPRYCASA
ncbi:MAG: hypothetical protein ACJ752_02355 [Gaiellaceae bacterium]